MSYLPPWFNYFYRTVSPLSRKCHRGFIILFKCFNLPTLFPVWLLFHFALLDARQIWAFVLRVYYWNLTTRFSWPFHPRNSFGNVSSASRITVIDQLIMENSTCIVNIMLFLQNRKCLWRRYRERCNFQNGNKQSTPIAKETKSINRAIKNSKTLMLRWKLKLRWSSPPNLYPLIEIFCSE